MSIKTWMKIGQAVQAFAYVAITLYLVKVVSTLIFGLWLHDLQNAGPQYYYWRSKHVDVESCKNSHASTAANDERREPVFNKYIGHVQPEITPKEKKELDRLLKLRKDTPDKETDEIKGRIEELQFKSKIAYLVPITPFYSPTKFVDTFILNPKSTFKIFRNKSKTDPTEYLDRELQFLAFRLLYIKSVQEEVKPSSFESWGYVDKKVVDKVFADYEKKKDIVEKQIQIKTSAEYKEAKDKKLEEENKTESLKRYPGLRFEDYNDFMFAFQRFAELRDPFETIIVALVNSTLYQLDSTHPSSNLVFTSSEPFKHITVDETLKDDFETITRAISTDPGHTDFRSLYEGFLSRIGLIKPTIIDAHILNRCYYYFAFLYPYILPYELMEVCGSDSATFAKTRKTLDETLATLKDGSSGPNKLSDSQISKLKLQVDDSKKKLSTFRMVKLFNFMSFIIAYNLPGYSSYTNSNAGIFKRAFAKLAYPSAETSKNEEDHKLFTIMMRIILEKDLNTKEDVIKFYEPLLAPPQSS